MFEAKRNLKPFGRDAGDFFLHIVESGRATLYFLLDRANEQHFFLQKDTVFQELLKKIVMDRSESGAIVKRTSNLFRGTLKTLLSECPLPVEKVNFSEASLRKAVHKYNQCLDPQDKSEKIERKKYIGLSAGVSSNTLRMESYTDRITEYGAYADISDYDQVYDFNSYTGGASIELPFGKNKHFSLLASILLTSVRLSNDKLDINYTELDFPFQLKYTVNVKKRVRLFGTGGMVFPLKLKNENRSKSIPMKLESYPYNEVGEIEPLARDRFIPPYLHFVSSVGLEVFLTPRAKIVTQLRFESLDMSRAFHIELRQQSRAVIVSYLFDLNKN